MYTVTILYIYKYIKYEERERERERERQRERGRKWMRIVRNEYIYIYKYIYSDTKRFSERRGKSEKKLSHCFLLFFKEQKRYMS